MIIKGVNEMSFNLELIHRMDANEQIFLVKTLIELRMFRYENFNDIALAEKVNSARICKLYPCQNKQFPNFVVKTHP